MSIFRVMRAEFAKLVGNQNPKGGGLGNPTSRKGREKWDTRRRGVYPGLTSLRRARGRLWAIVCRPSGAGPIFIGYIPTACAVGCILSPLRGCGRDRSEGSQNPQPSRLRAADRDASTALPVCHSRRETGERRGSKYQWVEGCGIPLLAKDARNGAAGGSGGAGRKAGPSTPRERPSDDHAPLGMTNQLG